MSQFFKSLDRAFIFIHIFPLAHKIPHLRTKTPIVLYRMMQNAQIPLPISQHSCSHFYNHRHRHLKQYLRNGSSFAQPRRIVIFPSPNRDASLS